MSKKKKSEKKNFKNFEKNFKNFEKKFWKNFDWPKPQLKKGTARIPLVHLSTIEKHFEKSVKIDEGKNKTKVIKVTPQKTANYSIIAPWLHMIWF